MNSRGGGTWLSGLSSWGVGWAAETRQRRSGARRRRLPGLASCAGVLTHIIHGLLKIFTGPGSYMISRCTEH